MPIPLRRRNEGYFHYSARYVCVWSQLHHTCSIIGGLDPTLAAVVTSPLQLDPHGQLPFTPTTQTQNKCGQLVCFSVLSKALHLHSYLGGGVLSLRFHRWFFKLFQSLRHNTSEIIVLKRVQTDSDGVPRVR